MARSGPLCPHSHTRRALVATFALAATLLVPSLGRTGVARAAPSLLHASPFGGCAPGDVVHRLTPTSVSIEPHRGFDPGTASDALLRCYGYPLPPRDAAGRAHWVAEMRPLRYAVPVLGKPFRNPDALASPPSDRTAHLLAPALMPASARERGRVHQMARGPLGTQSNALWVGPVATSNSNGGMLFTRADGQWTVPTMSYPPGYVEADAAAGAVSSWVGLGGDGIQNGYARPNQVLWQAGVYTIIDPHHHFSDYWDSGYYWFFEDAGCDSDPYNSGHPCPFNGQEKLMMCTSPSVTGGDQVRVYVDGQQGTYFYANRTKAQAVLVETVSIDNSNTDLSAEFITEAVGCDQGTCSNGFSPYPSWSDSDFTYEGVTSSDGSLHNVTDLNYYTFELCNNSTYGQYISSASYAGNGEFHETANPQAPYGSCSLP